MHSSASDGVRSPAKLVEFAQEKDIAVMAVTDHDTVDGVSEALAQKNGPMVLPGVELSATHEEMHILGYQIDVHNEKLLETLERLRQYRNGRNPRIIRKLQELGMEITLEEVEQAGKGSLGRAHIGRVLVEKGYVGTLKEAFDKYLGWGKPAFVEREKLPPQECIALIREAGGIAVLAHPSTLKVEIRELGNILQELKSYGLRGLEVYYPGQQEQQEAYRMAAKRLGLFVTGGSDYHGGSEAFAIEVQQCPDLQEGLHILMDG